MKPCHLHVPLVISTAISTDNALSQSSFRQVAVQQERRAIFHDPPCTSNSDVKLMCAEEYEDLPEPTTCIGSIVQPDNLHMSSISLSVIQAPTEEFQLYSKPRPTPSARCRNSNVHPRLPAVPNHQFLCCTTTCCALERGSYSQDLKANSPCINQRKLRPRGCAYIGLHQITSRNTYNLSYFESGRGLNVTI